MRGVVEILKELELFKEFSLTQLNSLIEKSELRTFGPRETIIKFGQAGSFLGIVLEGEAEAVVTDAMGERRRLGLLKRGDFLGEMSLLTGEPTSADVIALEECRLILIPQETFSTFLVVNPNAVRVMAKTLSERLKSRRQDEHAQARLDEAWRNAADPYGLGLSPATPARILVIRCDRSSIRYSYFDSAREANNLEGSVEGMGTGNSRITGTSRKGTTAKELGEIDHLEAFRAIVDQLTDRGQGVLKDARDLTGVAHHVLHGGDKYGSPVLISDEVIEDINRYSSLAPLSNPLSLKIIKASIDSMPHVPHIAVFDTAFHQKMPPHAYLYGLPYEFYEKDGIRRYGFQGISHNYVGLKAATSLKLNFREMRLITCHLDDTSSICAIDHGRSVDTSMGLTPLEGLMMDTGCGNLDPSIIMYLLKEKGLSIEEVDEILNRQSGLTGLSGTSGDLPELEKLATQGDPRALLAIHVFCYQVRKYIGAYIAALGGLDALVFTGAIGEKSSWVRGLACQGLSHMGIVVDDILNRAASPNHDKVADISDDRSEVKILVIPSDEPRMIALETIRLLGYENVAQAVKSRGEMAIPIELSAHHVHLSQEDTHALFGPGHELTFRAPLSQPGQYSCEETVNLIGPRGRAERVRVLGPVRPQSQVEIAITEEFKLGIKAPIRPSGVLDNTPGITVEGPKGVLDIPEGVICSLRHIHMAPEDALTFGLKDRDIVMVKVEGERTLIFGDVLIRVDPDFRLSMHIDTDEANAASIRTGMLGFLVGVQDRR